MKCFSRKYVLILLSFFTSFLMVSTVTAVSVTENFEKNDLKKEIEAEKTTLEGLEKKLEHEIRNLDFVNLLSKLNLIKNEDIDFKNLFDSRSPEVLSIDMVIWFILGTILAFVFSGFTVATTPFSWPIWGVAWVLNRQANFYRDPPTEKEIISIFLIGTLLGPISAFAYGYIAAAYIVVPGGLP